MGAKKDPKKDSKTPSKTPKKKEGGGGKAKKKKWSKGKSRDKLNNLVLFDKNTYDKLYKEVPSYKLITPSIVSERLKVKYISITSVSTLLNLFQVRGSLAKRALEEMASKGVVKLVSAHRSQIIYTRVTKDNEDDAPEGGVVVEKPQKQQKKGKKEKKAEKEEAAAAAAEAE